LGSCLDSKVEFDDSSIKYIFTNPGEVLKDIRGFWKKEIPYKTTLDWSDATRVPIDFEDFKKNLEELEKQSLEDRRKHEAYILFEKIMENTPAFKSRALPHVCSYLPANTKINAMVQIACFMPPWAYCAMGNVVINTSHKHWNSDVAMVLNIVIHELFHMGFGQYLEPVDFSQIKTREQTDELIMTSLQNEGMATYVAYKARHIFPSSTVDPDYRMLESRGDVLRLSQKINYLFRLSKSEPFEKNRDVIWKEGVMTRAFYVVGAYMAGKIEGVCDRDMLVDTIIKGSKCFIETYNELPSDGFKIAFDT